MQDEESGPGVSGDVIAPELAHMTAMRRRLRQLGLKVGYRQSGAHNAITDVPGVMVGHATLVTGEGKLVTGEGPVRTGVTTVLPHGGDLLEQPVPAAVYVFNGFGKPFGLTQLEELGRLETPVLLASTLNVPRVADAVITHVCRTQPGVGIDRGTINPVVLECHDGWLNDAQGRHVGHVQVQAALDVATGGPMRLGNIGAGTGMRAYHYKGGLGSASRLVKDDESCYTVGVLALLNCGRRQDLRLDGHPVGRHLAGRDVPPAADDEPGGSCILVAATDAPLGSRQLGRLAHRAMAGLARTGTTFSHGSGDLALAFSTSLPDRSDASTPVGDRALSPLFAAAVEAAEEAVLDSLFCASTMVGRDERRAEALPVEKVLELVSR